MHTSASPGADSRQCVFCGKSIGVHVGQCPYCREMNPQVRSFSPSRIKGNKEGGAQIRRGLLYMLLAAVVYYFAGGYGAPLRLPVQIVPIVVNYLLPLLFLGGLGFSLYGLLLRARS